MRTSASMVGLGAVLDDGLARFEAATTKGVREATTGLKEELREQTEAVLGRRLAFTWQGNVYPKGGTSLEPAGFVYSKAPKIISLFATGATIRPLNGREYLWIPTAAVPRARGGRGGRARMTPEEVERAFNTDIYVRRGRNGNFLAFVDVIKGRSTKRPGYRPATKGRLAQGRRVEALHVFTLVRQVAGRKLLDLTGPAQRWGGQVPALIEKNFKE